jgi:hypothetical protein
MVNVLAEVPYALIAAFIHAVLVCIPIHFILPRFNEVPGKQFRLYCKLVGTYTLLASAFHLATPLATSTLYFWWATFAPAVVTYLIGRNIFLRKLPYNSLKR